MKETQPLLSTPPVLLPTRTRKRPLPLLASERLAGTLVLLIALAQSALYLALVPPWQHYDEPTHFEYAWLIANRTWLPGPSDTDPSLRREIAASMLERGFFGELQNPNTFRGDRETWIGLSELQHPPTYYLLVSLPLRLVRHLDIASQLYTARIVSLLLFVSTIAMAAAIMRELTPAGHALRWAVPLACALLPPFVDLMTGVNNDVGVTAAFTLFLWGAVRTIRSGLNWRRLVWVFGCAGLAAAVKNTGAVALVLAILALLMAAWRQFGWRWRWLVALAVVGVAPILLVSVGWGDAAYWYRARDVVGQDAPTRAQADAAPFGPHALVLETRADGLPSMLIGPLLPEDSRRLAGHTITLGGWVWADRTATVSAPALSYTAMGMLRAQTVTRPVTVTTTPVFYAWTFPVPEQTYYLSYIVQTEPASPDEPPLRLYLDGALIADGAYTSGEAPVFDDATAGAGMWGGQRFINLIRNPSFDASWPRVQPWVDHALITYIHRTPAQLLTTLIDVSRLQSLFLPAMLRPPVDGLVYRFSWNQIRLPSVGWVYGLYVVGSLAIAGCVAWLIRARGASSSYPACVFLMLSGLLIWANTILRPLPFLGEQYVLPASRYTYPAIVITMLVLVGGWWAIWPAKWRISALAALLSCCVVLNSVAIHTILSFFY